MFFSLFRDLFYLPQKIFTPCYKTDQTGNLTKTNSCFYFATKDFNQCPYTCLNGAFTKQKRFMGHLIPLVFETKSVANLVQCPIPSSLK